MPKALIEVNVGGLFTCANFVCLLFWEYSASCITRFPSGNQSQSGLTLNTRHGDLGRHYSAGGRHGNEYLITKKNLFHVPFTNNISL